MFLTCCRGDCLSKEVEGVFEFLCPMIRLWRPHGQGCPLSMGHCPWMSRTLVRM